MKRVGFASAWDSMTRGNVAIDPDGNVYRIYRNRLEVMSGGSLPWCAAELKAVDVRGRWQVAETVE